jgi:hypothetical protein
MLLLPRQSTVLTKLLFRVSHTVLLWLCVMVMLRFLSRAPLFLAFPPPPPLLLFALNLTCRLAAVANDLLGMVNSDVPILLLPTVHTADTWGQAQQFTSDTAPQMAGPHPQTVLVRELHIMHMRFRFVSPTSACPLNLSGIPLRIALGSPEATPWPSRQRPSGVPTNCHF